MSNDSCGPELYHDYIYESDLGMSLRVINQSLNKYELTILKALTGCNELSEPEHAVINEFNKIPLIYSMILNSPVVNDYLLSCFARELRKYVLPVNELDSRINERIETCKEWLEDDELSSELINRLEHKINKYYTIITRNVIYNDLKLLKEACAYLLSNKLLKQP